MTTLTINGQKVKVSDDFLSLSPEEQNSTVDEIAKSLGAAPAPAITPEATPTATPGTLPVSAMSPVAQGGMAAMSGMTQGQPPERGVGAMLYDNFIGNPDDGVESFGERLGSGLNEVGKAGGAGVARGIGGLADIPGAMMSGYSSLVTGGLEGLGITSPEMSATMRDAMMGTVPGGGNVGNELVKAATLGGSEYRSDTTAGKIAGTVGEFLPGAALMGGANPANLLKYGVAPGVGSEAAGMATEGTAIEPFARFAGGMLAPAAVGLAGNVAKRVISPYGGADPNRLALAKILDDAGVPVSAGQKVGSDALRRSEGSTGAGARLADDQAEAFTSAVLKTAGINAKRATTDVVDDAFTRIGKDFDDVVKGLDVAPTPQVATRMADALDTYKQLAPKSTAPPIFDNINGAIVRSLRTGSAIPGATIKTWRSTVAKLMRSPDAAIREAAQATVDVLDDAINGSLTAMGRASDVTKLTTAREQYRNLLAIERAAAGASEGAAVGLLSPNMLAQSVKGQGRKAYVTGQRANIGDLARAGQGVLKPLPTSGTAENLRAMGVPGMLGAAAGASLGGPAGAAAGALAPLAINAAKMTKPMQAWLANQLAGASVPLFSRELVRAVPGALAQ